MSWVAWRRLATPKPKGGLGFRDIQRFNDALLGKIGWQILKNPNSLMARILLEKYCHSFAFLEVEAPSTASHGWRSILMGRQVLKKHICCAIGNGCDTRIWRDKWIPSFPGSVPFGPIPLGDKDRRVRDLLTEDGKSWDRRKIDGYIPLLRDAILSIKHSTKGAKDSYLWTGTKDGIYSTRSGYYAIVHDEDIPPDPQLHHSVDWNKMVWNILCAPKIKLFIWRLLSNALPTGHALASRGVVQHNLCPRCGQEETLEQLFFHCQFARGTWALMQWKSTFIPTNRPLVEEYMSALQLIPLPPTGVG